MWELARHYEQMRRAYPDDTLAVVFDIDGTILDMRYMVAHTLVSFDKSHGTDYFRGLLAEHVDVHENRVEDFLRTRGLPVSAREQVKEWYAEHLWSPASIRAATRPYRGVLGVIRWFQLQPQTVVALNTGRPEALRDLTLDSLNEVGRAYRVSFESRLLSMNKHGWGRNVEKSKVIGVRRLVDLGFRVIAVVDNEPDNLAALAEADETHEMLFLHADTISESQRGNLPRSATGKQYGLAGLVREADIKDRVEFIWHGVNDAANLRQFLGSDVTWGECDVRVDPLGRLVLRHDSFERTPWSRSEHPFLLEDCLKAFAGSGRRLALDIKENGDTVPRVLEAVAASGLQDSQVAFMGAIDALGEDGARQIRAWSADVDISVQVEFLEPLVRAAPSLADQVLAALRSWGVTILSLDWKTTDICYLVNELETRGWPVNIYGVQNLEAFLEAALLLPRSVIADFNFPDWNYYGRGSGQERMYHQYALLTG